jgi:hypothetical protein
MRLAELQLSTPTLAPGGVDVALVNPQTRTSDNIFLLRGCSVPVVVRSIELGNTNRCAVIGGVWLTKNKGSLREIVRVGIGQKGKVLICQMLYRPDLESCMIDFQCQ